MSQRRRLAVRLSLLALVAVEIALFVWIAQSEGFGWVVLIVLAGWVIGPLLLVLAGGQAFQRARAMFARAAGAVESPGHGALDRGRPVFTAIAGCLFLLPGLVTDAVGILLLLPPVQGAVEHSLTRRVGVAQPRSRRERRDRSGSGTVLEGEVIDAPGPGDDADPTVETGHLEK